MRIILTIFLATTLVYCVKNDAATKIQCPDHQRSCEDNFTCCPFSDHKTYGCCPIPNAVCCSDNLHCCPQWSSCNVTEGICVYTSKVQCPDKHNYCESGTTCCLFPDLETYGCCPLPNAICCSDHLHCCPESSTCNIEESICVQGTKRLPIYRKQPTLSKSAIPRSSGHDKFAPILQSNPIMTPEVNAKLARMTGNEDNTKFLAKLYRRYGHRHHQLHSTTTLSNTKCDAESECPDGSTCCISTTQHYGCCPMENAVCCADHTHCCPQGTTCDVAEGKCIDGYNATSALIRRKSIINHTTKSSIKTTLSMVKCGEVNTESVDVDETTAITYCDGGKTCCAHHSALSGFNAGLAPACCPFTNGVCCKGSSHCCPRGFRCASGLETCILDSDKSLSQADSGLVYATLIGTTPSKGIQLSTIDKMTKCNDGSICGNRETCCPVRNVITNIIESYQCCPLSKGKCCDGGNFCCPINYECTTNKRCAKIPISRFISDFISPPSLSSSADSSSSEIFADNR